MSFTRVFHFFVSRLSTTIDTTLSSGLRVLMRRSTEIQHSLQLLAFFSCLNQRHGCKGSLHSRHGTFFFSISKFGMIFSRPFGGHNTTTKCFCSLVSHT
jgi:hypothetical protein